MIIELADRYRLAMETFTFDAIIFGSSVSFALIAGIHLSSIFVRNSIDRDSEHFHINSGDTPKEQNKYKSLLIFSGKYAAFYILFSISFMVLYKDFYSIWTDSQERILPMAAIFLTLLSVAYANYVAPRMLLIATGSALLFFFAAVSFDALLIAKNFLEAASP